MGLFLCVEARMARKKVSMKVGTTARKARNKAADSLKA